MSKIMLVEDDNSLREIYEARLAAEGYTVVSAKDGEEALAMALKEHPDLIIADIMMPKVSGFDMLDILRSTPETKNTKIIMMTALSQAEDKARAEQLGADRYLVKSQVTLEDVTREARTILDALESQAAATVAKVQNVPTPVATPAPAPKPAPKPAPAASPSPTPIPVSVSKPAAAPATPPTPAVVPATPVTPTVTTIPVAAPDDDDKKAVVGKKDEKLAKTAKALSIPVKKEEAEVAEQVDEFIASNPTLSSSPEVKPGDTTASDAVDSLTKPADEKGAKDAPDDANRAYVATDSGEAKPSGSLEHTKTIQPTSDAERANKKPDLSQLMAKEGESMGDEAAPAVNSVISPNDTGGAPPTT